MVSPAESADSQLNETRCSSHVVHMRVAGVPCVREGRGAHERVKARVGFAQVAKARRADAGAGRTQDGRGRGQMRMQGTQRMQACGASARAAFFRVRAVHSAL